MIDVIRRRPHPVYTQSLAQPEILANARDFPIVNNSMLARFEVETVDSVRECLLVTCELDKRILCRLLIAAAFLSLLIALFIGLLVHQADLGIAISNLFATVLSCVEVVLVWLI